MRIFVFCATLIDRTRGRLRYPGSADRIFNRVILDMSVILRETTLTISDSDETGSPVETEMVLVVSLNTME